MSNQIIRYIFDRFQYLRLILTPNGFFFSSSHYIQIQYSVYIIIIDIIRTGGRVVSSAKPRSCALRYY